MPTDDSIVGGVLPTTATDGFTIAPCEGVSCPAAASCAVGNLIPVPGSPHAVPAVAWFAQEPTVLDLEAIDADLAGFRDGFVSDEHAYVLPLRNNDGQNGLVARFDVATFATGSVDSFAGERIGFTATTLGVDAFSGVEVG